MRFIAKRGETQLLSVKERARGATGVSVLIGYSLNVLGLNFVLVSQHAMPFLLT